MRYEVSNFARHVSVCVCVCVCVCACVRVCVCVCVSVCVQLSTTLTSSQRVQNVGTTKPIGEDKSTLVLDQVRPTCWYKEAQHFVLLLLLTSLPLLPLLPLPCVVSLQLPILQCSPLLLPLYVQRSTLKVQCLCDNVGVTNSVIESWSHKSATRLH